jgi:periplasmic divalent cation tolerance protein
MTGTPLMLVLTSEATAERAEALALALLERRLVACATLLPGTSLYHWRGRIERGEEVLLLLKTRAEQLESLQSAMEELHGYETPEWIHWPAATDGGYAGWLLDQLTPSGAPPGPAEKPAGGDPTG